MVLWLLSLLMSPAPTTSQVVLGLAVVVAVLLIALASGLAQPPAPRPVFRPAHRGFDDELPRLFDPDAPGRPRPRAPSAL